MNLQIDDLAHEARTCAAADGVITVGPKGPDGDVTVAPALGRPRWREWLMVAVVALSLLGLGERYRVDPRFVTPSRTLATYWKAMGEGDAQTVAECMVAGRHDLPFPGMLWFMPPSRKMWLDDFRFLPVSNGRMMVTYQVRYQPLGAAQEQSFHSGNELVRERGEWRIARPLGEASMPQWKPIPRGIDS